MGGCGSFCMFAYLAGSSPVFILGFGLAPSAVRADLRPVLLRADRRRHRSTRGCCRAGAVLHAAAIIAACLAGRHRDADRAGVQRACTSWRLIVAPIFVAMSCHGFSNANTTAGALSRHAAHAGSASALMGIGQYTPGRHQRAAGRAVDRRHAARHGGADAVRARWASVIADRLPARGHSAPVEADGRLGWHSRRHSRLRAHGERAPAPRHARPLRRGGAGRRRRACRS